jgi:hypothetical protein
VDRSIVRFPFLNFSIRAASKPLNPCDPFFREDRHFLMAEQEDMGRTIQRVIDDRYPCTRVLWQSFQPQCAQRQTFAATGSLLLNRTTTASGTRSLVAGGDSRYLPGTATRNLDVSRSTTAGTRTRDDKKEALDKVVQRVIDLRYPETRVIWMNSREEPAYLRTAGRSLTYGSSNRPQTVPH